METLLAGTDTANGELPESGNDPIREIVRLYAHYNRKVPASKQKMPN